LTGLLGRPKVATKPTFKTLFELGKNMIIYPDAGILMMITGICRLQSCSKRNFEEK
jgi:hypothetical protein